MVDRMDLERTYRANPGQERLWISEFFAPGSAVNHLAVSLEFSGELNISILEQSLGFVIDRHPLLRARFFEKEGQLFFRVGPRLQEALSRPNVMAGDRAALSPLIAAEAERPFNLTSGPLYRAVLFSIPDGQQVLVFAVHHIVFDAFSVSIFFGELAATYTDLCNGGPPRLEPLAPGAEAVTAKLGTQDLPAGDEAYWRARLDGAPGRTSLPIDRRRTAELSRRTGTLSRPIPPDIYIRLRSAASKNRVTIFSVLLGTYLIALSRYNGMEDLVVGSSIAHRPDQMTRNQIGFFVRTLVLRQTISPTDQVGGFLQKVQRTVLEAIEHANLPFDRIAQLAGAKPDLSQHSIFQSAFVLESTSSLQFTFSGIQVIAREIAVALSPYDFFIRAKETPDGMVLLAQYSLDLFEEASIAAFLDYLIYLYGRVPDALDVPISALGLPAQAEFRALVAFNQTAVPYAGDETFPGRFSAIARMHPDAPAVIHGSEIISYGALLAKSDACARHLADLGLGEGAVVGVALERGVELVAAILGIMKAGCCYLYLNPGHSTGLLTQMTGEIGVFVVLFNSSNEDNLPVDILLIDVADIPGWHDPKQTEIFADRSRPEAPAYVICTSGSTGKAKGVLVAHDGIVGLADWQRSYFGVGPGSRIAQLSVFDFDAAVGEMTMALLNGGALCIINREELAGDRLASTINALELNVLVTVPSVLRHLDPRAITRPERLTIVAVGEVCPVPLARKWAATCRFINGYGPTEFSVYSHVYHVKPDQIESLPVIPIGLPIDNTRSLICAQDGSLVPPGGIGEIVLAGRGVAIGYENGVQPERFPLDRFGGLPTEADFSAVARSDMTESLERLAAEYEALSIPDQRAPGFEAIASEIEKLQPKLRTAAIRIMAEVSNNDASLASFTRYATESLLNTYSSAGLTASVYREILGLKHIVGAVGADFGCANGTSLTALSELAALPIGLDFSPFFIDKLVRSGHDARLVRFDCEPAEFSELSLIAPGSLDFACATLVLDRVSRPDYLLQNMIASLRINGTLAIQTALPVVPNGEGAFADVIYTAADHRIADSDDEATARKRLSGILTALGVDGLVFRRLDMMTASLDGLRRYSVWSIAGRRRSPVERVRRLYRTGDMGRVRPDGLLEFLGRFDRQVKIRGQRVEIEAVEALLREHPLIADIAVAATGEPGIDLSLVGYAVPSSRQPSQSLSSELTAFARARLPISQIPSRFFIVESIPVTVSGKTDFGALRNMTDSSATVSVRDPPRGPLETLLAETWRDGLRIELPGRDDNVFDLGADSILIVQFVAALAGKGIACSVNDVFHYQTIAELATMLSARKNELVVVRQVAPHFGPVSPIQSRFLSSDSHNGAADVFALWLQIAPALDLQVLRNALEDVIATHDVLRCRCQRESGRWTLAVEAAAADPGSRYILESLDSAGSAATGSVWRRQFSSWIGATRARLDVLDGPRIAVAYASGGECCHLVVLIQHFVTDFISLAILMEDLRDAYHSRSRGTIWTGSSGSFLAWTCEIQNFASSPDFAADAKHWRDVDPRIGGGSSQALGSSGSRHVFSRLLAPNWAEALQRAVQDTRRRDAANEILAAAFGKSFAEWSGNSNVILHLESHGRDVVPGGFPVGRTVGWFTALHPIVLAAGPDEPIEVWLAAVRAANESLPAWRQGYLVSREPNNSLSRSAAGGLSIVVNYAAGIDRLWDPNSPWQLLEVSRVGSDRPSSDFDLEVNLWQTSQGLHLSLASSTPILGHVDLSALAERFSALLACLVAIDDGTAPQAYSRLAPAARGAGVALSPLQKGMFFHGLLAPHSGVYVNQMSMLASGDLDPQLLATAFTDATAVHEALRCSFVCEGGAEPVQIVEPTVEIPLIVEDWSDMEEDVAKAERERQACADLSAGFSDWRAPLMRLHIARLAGGRWVVTWTFHHILMDGWSVATVLRDVFAAYEARKLSKILPLTPSPSLALTCAASTSEPETARAFWEHKLAEIEEPTSLLQAVWHGPPEGREGYAEAVVKLSRTETAALVRWAREKRLTVNTVVEGAFAILLSRYADTSRVMFGATVSTRRPDSPDMGELVGLLINTVARIYNIAGNHSLAGFLADVQAEILSCLPFVETSVQTAHELSGVPRGHPLFESVLIFENYVFPDRLHEGLQGLKIEQTSFVQQSNYPLNFICMPGEELCIRLSYDRSKAEDILVSQILSHFSALLVTIPQHDDCLIDDLPMLSEKESAAVLCQGLPRNPSDLNTTIDRLFDEQVARTPDAVALIENQRAITYAELQEHAEAVAGFLRHHGVGPEDRVAVCMERSILMYAGLLGILKSGAAYVPLDPRYPSQRLERLALDAGTRIIFIDAANENRLGCLKPLSILLEEILNGPKLVRTHQRLDVEPTGRAATDALAYVMYTSGSTGSPKGILGTHRGTLNSILWRWDAFPFEDGEIACQKTSLAFGDSIVEIFGPLLKGVVTVIVPDDLARNPEMLVDTLAQHAVTRIILVPSLLKAIVSLPDAKISSLSSLRLWIASGESLSHDLISMFYRRFPVARLVNLYGASEISNDVTWTDIGAEFDVSDRRVPIGTPTTGMRTAVLDSRMRPVPPRVPGVLFVGGEGVNRGYLNRPDLTAAAFVPDPFGFTEPGSRLYRTGDMVAYEPGKGTWFLRRRDQQVKIRGQRIELDEVAATLKSHPDVHDAQVIAYEREPGDLRLAAYVVPTERQLLLSDPKFRRLPNGIGLVEHRASETEHMYREIVLDDLYGLGRSTLPPDSVVLDVGANIGLFALCTLAMGGNPRIYAFEPNPDLFRILQRNLGPHSRCTALDVGLSDEDSEKRFTAYDQSSLLSGFRVNEELDRRILAASTYSINEELADLARSLESEQLSGRFIDRPVKRLSTVIRELGLERIDLLKIDVERSEHDVLAGIDKENWPIIRRVVLEAEEISGTDVSDIVMQLRSVGFEIVTRPVHRLQANSLVIIDACRNGVDSNSVEAPLSPSQTFEELSEAILKTFLARTLPSSMIPQRIEILGAFPRTISGKIDRQDLLQRLSGTVEKETTIAGGPIGATEREIAKVWAEVLGRPVTNLDTNFFDLGGHSLLLIRVQQQLAEGLGASLSLLDLYRNPTIRDIVRFIDGQQAEPALPSVTPRRRIDRAASRRSKSGKHQ
jgi:amino acid adenylation domain-containing protein/FkbM family methyltransferase